MCLLCFLKWGSIGYPLWIVQWDFTRRDHPGNPGGGIRIGSCHKYSMKIYISKYHLNIKGAHHLITNFFFHSMWHLMLICSISQYNATLLTIFNIQIFAKHNQSSIFIIVFEQNESNTSMFACDGALLILRVTLTMTLIPYGLRPRNRSLGTCTIIKTMR